MHWLGIGVFEHRETIARPLGSRLRALAAALLTLASCMPAGYAQQAQPANQSGGIAGAGAKGPEKQASDLPAAPAPVPTMPVDLRTSQRDFSKPSAGLLGDPINLYRPTTIPKASFANSVRLANLVKDGKIYLSLSDAIALAVENNYDIAIARYDLDIADTDILRTRTGATPLGAPAGVLTATLGGSSSTLTTGGGPGGTTGGSGGAGSGVSGLTLTTAGAGPTPEQLDPTIGGTVQFERQKSPQTGEFAPRAFTNTNSYDFTFNKGFVTGTAFTVGWNNSRITTTSPFNSYSPEVSSNFKATVTQHLLQGAGIWINKRFMYQAINDRRITDSAFRQQILYTVNQVENIYWGLVQAYEDVQAKEHALEQSTKLDEDDRKQLQIGTMAPLDVVNADQGVASDKQALITSQSNLSYQQQIIKQAVARNLNDPALATAPVIPTDRVTLDQLSEEKEPIESLVQTAFQNRPELEQAALTLRNDEITLKGARNGLLPTFDVYGFYGAQGVGGDPNKRCNIFGFSCAASSSSDYGDVVNNLVNGSSPDKGLGFNVTIPIRNREAQSVQARSLMEYRQAELRLAQLYTQIRMQVVNAQYALANDRAQVLASVAARDYAEQSLDAEQKKLRLGASTTANVLLQERNLAIADNNLISAHAAFAKDRAGLHQILATTLQTYGINLQDAAKGVVGATPVVPGLQPAAPGNEPTTAPPSSR